jgi:hypothetical protein
METSPMIKHATHRLTLALTLAVLAIPAGRVFAQHVVTPAGVTGTDPEPQGVTGTDPEPQGVTGTDPEPQGVTGTDPEPQGVTGTDPEPQGSDLETILAVLALT